MTRRIQGRVKSQSIVNWVLIACLFGMLGIGCVAQKADLQKIHKDLDLQIKQIRDEKKELAKELEAARVAIAAQQAESQELISAQKSDMKKMRSARAELNQQIKLLREQDLTSLYGNFEDVEKKVTDLKKDFAVHKTNFSTTTETLKSDIQAIDTTVKSHGENLQASQAQTTALAQQIDENNQAITQQLIDFQTAFSEFKRALTDIGTELTTETQRASSAEAQLSAEIINQVQHVSTELSTQQQALHARSDDLSQSILQLQDTVKQSGTLLGTRLDEQTIHQTELVQEITLLQKKLNKDNQALRTFFEQDMKAAMDQLGTDMDDRQRPVVQSIDALQSDMEALGLHVQADATQVQELSQSVVKLREAQDVTGSLLGKRGDSIIQQAGRLSERMNTLESHQATLTQQLQSNTEKTLTHLTEVNARLTSNSKRLDQTTQSLSHRLTQQGKMVDTLNQGITQLEQLQDKTEGQIEQMQVASQLADALRQSVEQTNARLQDLEIHQSGLVEKLDSDAQTTTTHLQEVNTGIKSVAQVLENVSAKLNERISKQDQKLNRAVTSFQSVQNSVDTAQMNVQHLNELTEAMNQLQGVINAIGTKLGERVDEHEDRLGQLAQRVNHLQGGTPKK